MAVVVWVAVTGRAPYICYSAPLPPGLQKKKQKKKKTNKTLYKLRIFTVEELER